MRDLESKRAIRWTIFTLLLPPCMALHTDYGHHPSMEAESQCQFPHCVSVSQDSAKPIHGL